MPQLVESCGIFFIHVVLVNHKKIILCKKVALPFCSFLYLLYLCS